jgi:hypothetical protein
MDSRARRCRKPIDLTTADLVSAAALLLKAAGAEYDLLTVPEAADLAGVTCETARAWCRSGRIGRFDRRLAMYLIGKGELRAFLLRHWEGRLPARFDSVPTQAPSVLSFTAMTDDKPIRLPPLSAAEKTRLSELLNKVEGFRAGPVADALREEQKLKAEQERLAKLEEKAAQRLATLQSELDALTSRLVGRARQPGLARYLEALNGQLKGVLERRPAYAQEPETREELLGLLQAAYDIYVEQARAPKCRSCGQILSSETAVHWHDATAANAAPGAEGTAEQILRTWDRYADQVADSKARPRPSSPSKPSSRR